MPCADQNDCSKTEISHTQPHEKEQSQHNDNCSPLCVCNCCNTVTAQFEFDLLEELKEFEFIELKEPEFKLPIVSTPFYPIWQPPKLV